MRRPIIFSSFGAVVVGCILLVACGSGSSAPPTGTGVRPSQPATGSSQATAVPVEDNPPGDIPDNQAFVSYHSDPGGYTLDTPEGWARTVFGPNAQFVDKLHSVAVDVTTAATAPTVASVTANELPTLAAQVEAFEKVTVEAVDLPSGQAVLVRYRANSAPDAVTGKKVRLEVDRYDVFKDGKMAAVSLSAPAGSDNVDVWKQISTSFKWG
jgi:hypothetical protein